jgi:flagellar basal-body rod modification protein FlgD
VDLLGQSLMSSQAALQASSMVGQQAYVKTDLAFSDQELVQ